MELTWSGKGAAFPPVQLAGVARVYVVEERANPSTDYFVAPRLPASERVVRCGFADCPPASALDGAVVILVRYVPPAWRRLIERERPRIAQLVYFMDDDILSVSASRNMPWRYRYKLASLGAWRARWLRRMRATLWVSTPYLQARYADWPVCLVSACPVNPPEAGCRVFYHGSASHRAEQAWLYEVMDGALHNMPSLSFELIGDSALNRQYRRLPRVTVVHPMSWEAYRTFLAQPGRHIGLAPLLDSAFNRARSPTKFFDITSAGAVGIYAAHPVFAGSVVHDQNGWVVDMQPAAWVNAILRLATDRPLHSRLLARAQADLAGWEVG